MTTETIWYLMLIVGALLCALALITAMIHALFDLGDRCLGISTASLYSGILLLGCDGAAYLVWLLVREINGG